MKGMNKLGMGSTTPRHHDYDEDLKAECRQLISVEVMNRLYALVERLEMVSERTHGKLGPIMMPNYPVEHSEEAKGKQQDYPEYFAQIRSFSDRIEYAIDSIDNALSRVEF